MRKELNYAGILHNALTKKKYGVVNRNGNKFARNYKRELKNGKGWEKSKRINEKRP